MKTGVMLIALALLGAAGCGTVPTRAALVPPYRPDVKALDVRGVPLDRIEPAPAPAAAAPATVGAGDLTVKTLLPGDRLVLTVRASPNQETVECVIDESGSITLDLVGRVKVGGQTPAEAEKTIGRAYVEGGYYKTAAVSIIPPSRAFLVKGCVARLGYYPIDRPKMTVLQALILAGGWNEFADPRKIRLIRGEDVMILNMPNIQAGKETDIYIESGDVIEAPKKQP